MFPIAIVIFREVLEIALILGVLYSFGLFSPSTYYAQECAFPSGFSCISSFIAPNGLLSLNLRQSLQDPINVTALGCNQNATTANGMVAFTAGNQVYLPIGANYTFTVQCYLNSNSPFTVPIGASYSGYVIINYTDAVTLLPFNSTFGKVVARVS